MMNYLLDLHCRVRDIDSVAILQGQTKATLVVGIAGRLYHSKLEPSIVIDDRRDDVPKGGADNKRLLHPISTGQKGRNFAILSALLREGFRHPCAGALIVSILPVLTAERSSVLGDRAARGVGRSHGLT